MRRGDLVSITPSSLNLSGEGEQNTDGVLVSTPNLFVGEQAEVRIEHVSKGAPRGYGRVEELKKSSPHRREVPCRQHPAHASAKGRCSGCALMPLAIPGQHEQKLSMLQGLGLSISEVIANKVEFGYRHSVKRVAYGGRHLRFGSYVRGSHDVADMEDCMVDHPRIVEALDEIVRRSNEIGLGAYGKHFQSGVRYALLKTDGVDVTANLVVGEKSDALILLAKSLTLPRGVTFSLYDSQTNSMRAGEAQLLNGTDDLTLQFGEVQVAATTMGFTQPNPVLANTMYTHLLSDKDGEQLSGAHAFDLYAGSGLLTHKLRSSFARVDPCESHPASASALGVSPQPVGEFLSAALLAQLKPDLIVANPPRKGLRDEVCKSLLQLRPARIHIMSCGPKGLAQDLERLTEHYDIESLVAFDTLPQTPHVEVIAKLRLKG